MLISLEQLWTRSKSSLAATEQDALKTDCVALSQRFSGWYHSCVPESQPVAIGHINERHDIIHMAAGSRPGKIETYFDLYVAGVWNIFRIAQLLLISLTLQLANKYEMRINYEEQICSAVEIAEGIFSSVPYHLTDNLQSFLSDSSTSSEITNPGKSLGGLLLMHPLYIISELPFLPEQMRKYSRQCFKWISLNMGFG